MNRWIPAAAAVLLLAGCGTAAASNGTNRDSVASSDNAQVCRNYLKQRAWVKSLTSPNLADALQFETDVAVDAVQASGKLRADLDAMQQAQRDGRSDYAPSGVVLAECS